MTPAIDITASQRKTLLAILRRYIPGVLVWAYGSRVKFTARPHSDLDLVVFTSPAQKRAVSDLKDALAESNLPFLVDLHVWDEVPEKFHEIIRKEYVVVQEQHDFVLPHNWRKMSLEDSMAAIIDYRGKTPEKTAFGVPLVTAKIVKGGRIEKPEEFIAEADFDDWMRRGMPKPGDIVMTTEAPLGEVAQLDGRKVAVAQRVITLRGKPDLLDNTFLKFLLQSNPVQEELRSRGTGTTVVGIRQSELRKVSLTLPPLAEQKAIAAVLGALDDMIELNRRMNATLEAMARALFQSWFVDFDPVRAKLDGRQPAATAALFPSSFQDSELGPIPKGWRVSTLGMECEYGGGNIQTGPFGTQLHASDYVEKGVPSIMPSDLRDNRIDISGIARIRESDAERLSVYRVQPGDVVYSRRGDVERRSLIRREEAGWLCGTGCLRVRFGSNGLNPFFGASYLGSEDSRAWVVRHAVGATMPNLNTSILGALPMIVPPLELQVRFAEIVGPWDERGTIALNQSRTLATLRDTLLPKLLSGELRIN